MNHLKQLILLAGLLLAVSASAYIHTGNVYFTDGTTVDVQAANDAASDGSVIELPAGGFTYTNGVAINKRVAVVGAGAGFLFGDSVSSVAVGTGSKTFFVSDSGQHTVTNGMTVCVYYTACGDFGQSHGNSPTNMTGTVTSYDGSNLVLNVTSFNGGGTLAFWTLGTAASTVITNSCQTAAFNLASPTNGYTEFAGIKIIASGLNGANGDDAYISSGGAGVVLVHDDWFSVANVGARAIASEINRGVIFHCSFDAKFDSGIGGSNGGNNDQGINTKCDNFTNSWENNQTLGTNDVGYTNNFYAEDNYLAGFFTGGTDFDDNSRVVFRYDVMNQAVCSSHGYDTSPYGLRQFDINHVTFKFHDDGQSSGSSDFDIGWWWYDRGGMGVIWSNNMPDITSSYWGNKNGNQLAFVAEGPYRLRCDQTTYPALHQIGQSISNTVPITDPICIWGNTLNYVLPSLAGYGANQNQSCYADGNMAPYNTTNIPPISLYLQNNRDFNTNSVYPSYVPVPYPLPLRTNATASYTVYPPAPIPYGLLWALPIPYYLTVSNGVGSGSYTAGTVVNITTNSTIFTNWYQSASGYIANTNLASTTVTMPAANLTVRANYYTTTYPPTVGWWKMQENMGTTIGDSIGSNPGTLVNSAGWAAGPNGGTYSVYFDGSAYINLGSSSALTPSGSFTLSAWIYPYETNSNHSFYGVSSGGIEVRLNTSGQIELLESGTALLATSTGIVYHGWHQATVTYDGSTVKFYIDGSAAGSVGSITTSFSTGAASIGCTGTGQEPFDGLVTDVGLWNTALTSGQVTANYTVFP